MDGIKGNLDDHLTLISNSNFTTAGYDKLAMQAANGGLESIGDLTVSRTSRCSQV